ncbi:MAG: ZIP family metal transporter [Clostridia bacterium]
MEHIISVTLYGILAGVVGTAIGGIIAVVIKRINNKYFGLIMEFSAGLMIAIVCFDLLPTALELGNIVVNLIGIIAGLLLALILEEKIKYSQLLSSKNPGIATGILLIAAVTAHNFPEGLAIGTGFEASFGLGISIVIVMIVHNIPEGLTIAMPFKKAGVKPFMIILITALTGLPIGIGAFVGACIGNINPNIIAFCLSLAGGAMLYVTFGDLLPQAKKAYDTRLSTVMSIIGIVVGLLLTMFLE